MYNETNYDYMEDFYERIAKYDALIIEADNLIEQDMNDGIIKLDKSIFNDFVKNAVICIYCADINANVVMEFIMTEEDNDGIIMELLDCFNV